MHQGDTFYEIQADLFGYLSFLPYPTFYKLSIRVFIHFCPYLTSVLLTNPVFMPF